MSAVLQKICNNYSCDNQYIFRHKFVQKIFVEYNISASIYNSKTYRSFYLTIQRNKMLIADWKTVVKEEGKKEWKCSVKCFLYEHLCPIISLVPLFPEVALKIKKIFELNSTIRTPF